MGCCPTSGAANSPTEGPRRGSETKRRDGAARRDSREAATEPAAHNSSGRRGSKPAASSRPAAGEDGGDQRANAKRRSGGQRQQQGPAPAPVVPPQPPPPAAGSPELTALFERCLAAGGSAPERPPPAAGDALSAPESFEALAAELALRGPEDPTLLAVLHLLRGDGTLPWTVLRGEWHAGWQGAGVRTLAEARQKAASLRGVMTDRTTESFRRVYLFVFSFVRAERQSKTLDAEVALEYWELLLSDWPRVARWCTFWRWQLQQPKGRRCVTRDEWAQLLEFSKDPHALDAADSALSAWPTVIDDFIEWHRCTPSEGA